MTTLIGRALRSSAEGGWVTLRADADRRRCETVVRIDYGGSGARPEGFEPTVGQDDSARAAMGDDDGGFGLGMRVARELVELHLGRIGFRAGPGGGRGELRFSLPAWDPERLLTRSLQRLARPGRGADHAALLVARVQRPVATGLSNFIDEFLQHSFRGDDLAVRVLPHKWLAVAACGQRQSEDVLAQVQTEWEQSRAQCLGDGLPRLELETGGVWRLPFDADEATRVFRAELPLAGEVPPDESIAQPALASHYDGQ
jgi:hypothetical protein